MSNGVSSSRYPVLMWATMIVFVAWVVWVTLGDLVLCLFAALRHSAVHHMYPGYWQGPALAGWVVISFGRDKRDGLSVPLFFLGLVVCFLGTLPVVRSCSFESGTHEIAVRGTAMLIPMLLAKAVCWAYVLRLLKLRGRAPS
jgi:hypothetical protein